jgi:protein SCO1
MKSIQHSYTWALLTLVLLMACSVHAQEPTAGPQTVVPNTQENNAQRYFTDTVLINQNGERMRFYTDLMKDKTVIIDTFFATCQASCLPMNRNLAQIQEGLGDRLGKDVNILSISVDPGVDTPTLLKAYSKKLNAKPGWYFLTGDKESIDFILKKLGQFVDDKNDHLNIFLIGNNRTGLWKKAFGLAKSEELMKVVDSVVNDPGTAAKPPAKP